MNDHRNVIVNKPWGYEYLAFESEEVALWVLVINPHQSTSMHCHPTKTTGLVLLSGLAELAFLGDSKIIKSPDKQMLRRGLFHSTRSISEEPLVLLEIETPNDKNDIIRLRDAYGRKDLGYEGTVHEQNRSEDCLWIIDDPNLVRQEYLLFGLSLFVERPRSIDYFRDNPNDDILIFLRGGLGKTIDHRFHLATMPGDIGLAGIVGLVANEMDLVQEGTLVIRVPLVSG